MGCGEGGPVHKFLKMVGLDSNVTFNELDHKCFDLISIKQLKIEVPHGLDNYETKLKNIYPEYSNQLQKYFSVLHKIYVQAEGNNKVVTKWDLLMHPLKHRTVLRYRNYTLHDLFEELGLPQELRAILAGQAGNLSACPRQASLLMHAAMVAAYCESAHFPKQGMEHFVNSIASIISDSPDCRIITGCKVNKISCEDGKVSHIETSQGAIYGDNFISNIDPHRTMSLLEGVELPQSYKKRMSYEYSDSVFTVYLGLKDVDLAKHGFGRRNIWHHSLFDTDKEYMAEIKNNDFSHPWLFISTPSLNADEGVLAPRGSHTMEILTFVNYDYFKNLSINDPTKFEEVKKELYEHMLDVIDEKYLPNIRQHIDEVMIHTPLDVERMLRCPRGNVYGSRLTPENYNLNRITSDTPIKNLHLVGATSAYPGMMGVILGSLTLFQKLETATSTLVDPTPREAEQGKPLLYPSTT